MKNLTLLIMLIHFAGFSQNVTLDELINLRKKNLTTVEETLSSKGWTYINGESPSLYSLGKATFAYKKSTYDDTALSFLTYYYSEDNSESKIAIQINTKDKYNSFLLRLKALGFKLMNSEISDGSIIKNYKVKSTSIKIEISTSKEELSDVTKTYYHFVIYSNINFDQSLFNQIIADTTAVIDVTQPSAEEIIGVSKIEKKFFVGRWSCDNSTITFYENGRCKLVYPNGDVSEQNWDFGNKKVTFDSNLPSYIIFSNDYNSFKYQTSANGEIHYAYKVGD